MWAAGKPASCGRQTKTKSIVAIAAEVRVRPRYRHWPDPNEPRRGCGCEEPDPVCPNNRGAWLLDRPNRWLVIAYSGLANQGYDHQPRSFPPVATRPTSSRPRVHRVASALLDRWWLGIHHGAIDAARSTTIRRVHSDQIAAVRRLVLAVRSSAAPAGGAARAGYKGLVGGFAASETKLGDTRAKVTHIKQYINNTKGRYDRSS